MAPPPPFDPSRGSPHDLGTYSGRVQHFLDVIDPRSLLESAEHVAQARQLVANWEQGGARDVDDATLWRALKLSQAAVNPGTGETVPLPLRMAAFVPMNVPIIWGMLNATTPAQGVFWQWVNQSYNSGLNYANRSGSQVATSEILQSYALAVTTAIGISMGVNKLGEHGPKPVRALVRRVPFIVPYLAVAGAGAANVYASRRTEIVNGVPVFDRHGNALGVSREAGKQGVYKTILTRSLGLPLPVLILPPLVAGVAVPASATPQTRAVFELVIVTMCLAGALPLTIAMYPQKLELSVSALEPEFQTLKDEEGQPITSVFCNKGL